MYIEQLKCELPHTQHVIPFTQHGFEKIHFNLRPLQGGGYSDSKSKRYLRWHRHRLLDVFPYTPASPLPCRLDIIFDLEPELGGGWGNLSCRIDSSEIFMIVTK